MVTYHSEDTIGCITLDNPPANSYDQSFMEELGQAIIDAADDDAGKVIILRSSSPKFFSAGADVKTFAQQDAAESVAMIELAHQALGRIASIPKIFIALIQGHALGGGLEMALACDLRFGARGSYKLGTPEVTLGLLPGNGGTQRLPRLIGLSRALDLMITGRRITPGQAHALGILDRLLPADGAEGMTLEYARTLAGGAVEAIGAIKQAAVGALQLPLEDGLTRERELVAGLFRSRDAREGLSAFIEKREPAFGQT
ncbi:MAG: enoyl-CoA hydratase/isomerase family protein [Solirubrobacterales bacterium]|nr:enoyl-CoA hydratase/isomerase family protein [Solirubrobacterales bacterium]MBV9944170.1 enoyl-CoA hydratase/isomerase family protein [Solirubrobacterales bacterium]